MRIVSIELNGFKRMALNGIKRFKLTPTARVQLILGANGSGKSSLIAELSPLPAEKANYEKDGSKIIVIEAGGIYYTLTSDFANHHTHSFMRGDEELNDGGTITVQRELVKTIFGITQEKHDICTGVERFTRMSPSRKRVVLTDMCDVNFDYALKVFNKAKELHRDTTGALKLAKKRLVTETAKLVSPEVFEKVETEVKSIIHDIDLLYRNRTRDERQLHELETERQELERQIYEYARVIFLFKNDPVVKFLTPEEIQFDIDSSKADIAANEARLETAMKEFGELQKSHEVFLKTGNADATSLKFQIHELKQKQKEVLAKRKLGLEFTDAKLARDALAASTLGIVLVELKPNQERKYSQKNLQDARDKQDELKAKLVVIDQALDKLRHQRSHFDNLLNGGQTECPSCNHRWVIGYRKSEHESIIRDIDRAVADREKIEIQIKENAEVIFSNEQYGIAMRDYMRIVRSTPILNPFWEYLAEADMVYSFPTQALTKADILERDLEFSCEALEIQKEIDRLSDLMELAVKASNMSAAVVTEKLQKTEELIGIHTVAIKRARMSLEDNQKIHKRTVDFLNHCEIVRQLVARMSELSDENLMMIRNELINKSLSELQLELAKRQALLNDFRMQQGIVDDIRVQVKTLEQQEAVVRLVVSELSPTDGLIAEGLLGFIRVLVRKMNLIIKKIWSYRLEVLDCSVGEGESAELDYRFPVMVENEPSPDVSKTSLGQQEVIDLAFRIIATSYYELNNGPLFLDEFGSGLDVEHRANAVFAIQSILEQLPFSQLFLVSHYMEQSGAFKNSEICALSKTNIVLPEKYNEHVEIS